MEISTLAIERLYNIMLARYNFLRQKLDALKGYPKSGNRIGVFQHMTVQSGLSMLRKLETDIVNLEQEIKQLENEQTSETIFYELMAKYDL
ncbi:hypothetical protein BN7874_165 [Phage NCTB]|nr:hypothetical protein BN7874_165 [Phage NCTB]